MIPLLIIGAIFGAIGLTAKAKANAQKQATQFSTLQAVSSVSRPDFYPTSNHVRQLTSYLEGAPAIFNPVGRQGGSAPSGSVPSGGGGSPGTAPTGGGSAPAPVGTGGRPIVGGRSLIGY